MCHALYQLPHVPLSKHPQHVISTITFHNTPRAMVNHKSRYLLRVTSQIQAPAVKRSSPDTRRMQYGVDIPVVHRRLPLGQESFHNAGVSAPVSRERRRWRRSPDVLFGAEKGASWVCITLFETRLSACDGQAVSCILIHLLKTSVQRV